MQNARQTEQQTIYAFARVEQWLDDYARSNQIPSHELTERVADLLLAQTRREVLGPVDRVPALRGHRAAGNSTARTVEVARGAHRKAQRKTRIVRRPRTVRKIQCKQCGKFVKNINMGNHVRYNHPQQGA